MGRLRSWLKRIIYTVFLKGEAFTSIFSIVYTSACIISPVKISYGSSLVAVYVLLNFGAKRPPPFLLCLQALRLARLSFRWLCSPLAAGSPPEDTAVVLTMLAALLPPPGTDLFGLLVGRWLGAGQAFVLNSERPGERPLQKSPSPTSPFPHRPRRRFLHKSGFAFQRPHFSSRRLRCLVFGWLS